MNERHGTEIYVKGRSHIVPDSKVSFDQVVKLAYPQGKRGPLFEYEVEWKDGPKDREEGTLKEGETIPVVKGMRFYVSFTDKT